jgi:hypothetical protein
MFSCDCVHPTGRQAFALRNGTAQDERAVHSIRHMRPQPELVLGHVNSPVHLIGVSHTVLFTCC